MHPDTNELLHLERGMQLRKESYLKTHQRYRVPISLIEPYDRNGIKYRLDSQSLEIVSLCVDLGRPIKEPLAVLQPMKPSIYQSSYSLVSGNPLVYKGITWPVRLLRRLPAQSA